MEKTTINAVWELITNVIKFPNARICKHLVAANLLSFLESQGVAVDYDLANAIVVADDVNHYSKIVIVNESGCDASKNSENGSAADIPPFCDSPQPL